MKKDVKTDYSQIGYCGYNCGICPGRSNDKALRRRMVEGWKKLFGHTGYTEENVPIAKPCAGCKGNGEVADKVCRARGCAKEKGVVLCADCTEFPCEKMRHLMADRTGLVLHCCRGKNVTKQEYELAAKQFESMPVLVGRLIQTGKLPSWTSEEF